MTTNQPISTHLKLKFLKFLSFLSVVVVFCLLVLVVSWSVNTYVAHVEHDELTVLNQMIHV